jgi:serine/alanine adding enzyme
VLLRLDRSEDDLWDGYPSVQRNMVRRARAAGLAARALDHDALPGFVHLYRETMARLGAAAVYDFRDAYFTRLAAQLDGAARLFGVLSKGRLVAGALFLLHDDTIHYHLAGSSADGRRHGAGNLLLHEAASWGRASGHRLLHLGGGRTGERGDSLLRFKLGISRIRCPVHVATRVHDDGAYEALCSTWLEQHRPGERPPYFLLYRLDPAAGAAA